MHPLALVCLGVLVTGVALPESWRAWPFAPFPLLHATVAIAIPLWFRAGPTGRPWPEIRTHIARLGPPAVTAIAFIGGFILLYGTLLTGLGKADDPAWNLIVTYQDFGESFVARYGRTQILIVSYLLLGLWPMFGEELFYRGFLFRGLTGHISTVAAAIVTSALFGLRHAAQLAYLLPAYPAVAGVAYFVWAFGLSMIWCWVYARTRSLWLCIASHGVNLVLAPFVLAVLDRSP
jgi:membrane protease YdiL (CAAX protease family)